MGLAAWGPPFVPLGAVRNAGTRAGCTTSYGAFRYQMGRAPCRGARPETLDAKEVAVATAECLRTEERTSMGSVRVEERVPGSRARVLDGRLRFTRSSACRAVVGMLVPSLGGTERLKSPQQQRKVPPNRWGTSPARAVEGVRASRGSFSIRCPWQRRHARVSAHRPGPAVQARRVEMAPANFPVPQHRLNPAITRRPSPENQEAPHRGGAPPGLGWDERGSATGRKSVLIRASRRAKPLRDTALLQLRTTERGPDRSGPLSGHQVRARWIRRRRRWRSCASWRSGRTRCPARSAWPSRCCPWSRR